MHSMTLALASLEMLISSSTGAFIESKLEQMNRLQMSSASLTDSAEMTVLFVGCSLWSCWSCLMLNMASSLKISSRNNSGSVLYSVAKYALNRARISLSCKMVTKLKLTERMSTP